MEKLGLGPAFSEGLKPCWPWTSSASLFSAPCLLQERAVDGPSLAFFVTNLSFCMAFSSLLSVPG